MKIRDIGEIKLIERISKGIKLDSSVIKGIGDDAAVIEWKADKYLLYTCDMLIEGVHFSHRAATPLQIGWKAMARNISDIAAMGGQPRYAVISLGVDPDTDVSIVDGIYEGLKSAAARFNVNIVGGDISKSKKTVVDVSLIGEVEKKNLVKRSGAKPGDLILVTGALGGSMKGKHLTFTPRVNEARMLVRNFKINSMIDVSDGLLLDLSRIMNASSVGAAIYETFVPVSKQAASFERAVTDGEDFELLFTMSPREADRFFRTMMPDMDIPVTVIGTVTGKSGGFKIVYESGRIKKIKGKGYLHF